MGRAIVFCGLPFQGRSITFGKAADKKRSAAPQLRRSKGGTMLSRVYLCLFISKAIQVIRIVGGLS